MNRFNLFQTKPPAQPQKAVAGLESYWSLTPQQLTAVLNTTEDGLQQSDAEKRIKQYGPNALQTQAKATVFLLLWSQFKSPLVLILVFAAIISVFVGEWADASIVLVVVIGSTMLGFIEEYQANSAVDAGDAWADGTLCPGRRAGKEDFLLTNGKCNCLRKSSPVLRMDRAAWINVNLAFSYLAYTSSFSTQTDIALALTVLVWDAPLVPEKVTWMAWLLGL